MTDNEILNENIKAKNKYLREEYLSDYCANKKCTDKNGSECDNCMYEKGRADAIEEFGNWLFENGYDSSSHNIQAWITEYNLRDKVAEQLKEKK